MLYANAVIRGGVCFYLSLRSKPLLAILWIA
jgi:hypothetical protein